MAAMKHGNDVPVWLLLLACTSVAGCSLKDLLPKAEDGGATAASADASATVAAVAPSAPASAGPAASAAAATTDAGATAKNAATAATAKDRYAVPTCPKGQVPATIAMSPFKAFCGAPCKTDADCKGLSCTAVNALAPNAPQPYIKVCDPETPEAPSGKPAASAAPAPAAATKCRPNEHFDDISKKCRPLGDCPKGFRWNEPMQTCLDDS